MPQSTLHDTSGTRFVDGLPEAHGADSDLADTAALPIGGGIFLAPDGAWLREDSSEFLAALGDPDPDYDAPLFAIKNLGFILVRLVDASLVEVTLHPRNVEPAALRSLHHWLQSFESCSFKFNYMRERWVLEHFTAPVQLMCRLFEITASEMPEELNYFGAPVVSDATVRQFGDTPIAH